MNRWPDSVARKIRAPAEWAEWRSGAGPQVALVVGSFDLLHPGNLSLLIRARQIAPRTVVLLQPDPPPAGRAGPLSHPLAERAEFLAHLHLVDLISTWPGPGPDPLAALRPFRWITAESHVDTEPGHDWIRREAEAVVRHPDQPGTRYEVCLSQPPNPGRHRAGFGHAGRGHFGAVVEPSPRRARRGGPIHNLSARAQA